MKLDLPEIFGCPICGYMSRNVSDIKMHLIEKGKDPAHQDYEIELLERVN